METTTGKVKYVFSAIFVLISHLAMLTNMFYNGNCDPSNMNKFVILAITVIGLDILYFIAMLFFKQSTYTIDFMLIFILNISLIFQSSFGGISLSVKHLVTCIASLISCRLGFILCRNHKWIQAKKKAFYIATGIIMLCILTLTGSRSMWIDLGFFTIQPSEFLKPAFILVCTTYILEQQNKISVWKFNIVPENLICTGFIILICGLQWWCRDLGSLPTFVAIYLCGLCARLCYPKAKLSKKMIITGIASLAVLAITAIILAPPYVKSRLFVDIWNDTSGDGYQQSQALIAIANGGWFGKGAGNGDLHNIFAYETDLVFASICEEWGLFFAIMVVCAILIMLASPLVNPPRSYFHATLATGVCSAFVVQMALNIFGSCNMIPFTGVTVPFISQGGSSMVTCGFMMGMLIAGQSPVFKNPTNNKKKKVKSK
ncbi:MAG: FtsW/RodA/SpoVE family cell cycle protein [Oscillospiraceae bacterium]|nr:FtsW/RodA/SpoVE family cell cycle protein [Oscillospiraceae bacterium]